MEVSLEFICLCIYFIIIFIACCLRKYFLTFEAVKCKPPKDSRIFYLDFPIFCSSLNFFLIFSNWSLLILNKLMKYNSSRKAKSSYLVFSWYKFIPPLFLKHCYVVLKSSIFYQKKIRLLLKGSKKSVMNNIMVQLWVIFE